MGLFMSDEENGVDVKVQKHFLPEAHMQTVCSVIEQCASLRAVHTCYSCDAVISV
jgi:hypothetical protein